MTSASVSRLLVSLRDPSELMAVLTGGAEWIDLKDPARGSLGRARDETIAAVATWAVQQNVTIPLSVALGELTDAVGWESVPRLPPAITTYKLGLSRCRSVPDWEQAWLAVRERLQAHHEQPLQCIAVAYVDHLPAEAPHPDAIVQAALRTGCRGILFDTFLKTSGSLMEHVDERSLGNWIDQARDAGLLTALAGKLTPDDWRLCQRLRPDLVAVRSAVCQDFDRQKPIVADLVRRWSLGIKSASSAASQHTSGPQGPGGKPLINHVSTDG